MPVPNAIAAFPVYSVTTEMIERKTDDNDTTTIEELMDIARNGVEFQTCQMTTT